MDLKRTVLRNITALMLGGVLLSPFVSNANDAIGHESYTNGNVTGQNHMVSSNQVHSDMDITHVGMDNVNMTGDSSHYDSGNGNPNVRSGSSRSLDTHQGNIQRYNTNQTHTPYDHRDQLNGGSNHHSSSSRTGGMH